MKVAPRAGAWIETRCCLLYAEAVKSPLARGRGLKLDAIEIIPCTDKSPLARGRGLKLQTR